MQPHQQRVIDEKIDLDEKIGKLGVFLSSSFFPLLPNEERKRLLKQEVYMESYSGILGERIEAFNN